MKKILFLIPLLLMLVITACNGPKKLTKKADALAVAGIHKEAVEFYISSV